MPRRFCCLLIILFAACVLAQEKPIALEGTVLTSEEAIPGGMVLIEHGVIRDVGLHLSLPAGTTLVKTDGVIAPGLIDLHNHLTWNIFPRWKPNEEFGSRYDWQQTPVYKVLMDAPHQALVEEGLECDAERYAEVKAITEGETSVVGSLRAPCNRGLARNLDDLREPGATAPELGANAQQRIVYNVFPLQMTEPEISDAKQALGSGGALLIHLAEGAPNNASAAREFLMLKGRGLLMPGVSLIHAVALQPDDFREMSAAGVGFVWSPRSNMELYGGTANVAAALASHVVTALAPDWSPTGSDGLLGELQFAAIWNATQPHHLFDDHSLADMATVNAAKLVHMDHKLGQIRKGYAADLLIIRGPAAVHGEDPWWTLDHAGPEQVELVMVGGEPIYGDTGPMQQLLQDSALETLNLCGSEKRISFRTEPGSPPAFAGTEARLRTALRAQGRTLAPLSECGN